MNVEAKVGGRRQKNDPRDLRNWVGKLTLQATREGDQFILAALYRLLSGMADDQEEIIKRIDDMAKECLTDHSKQENAKGVAVRIGRANR